MAGDPVLLTPPRSTRRSPSQGGLREAGYVAMVERSASKKGAVRQRSRHVALSGLFMLCFAVSAPPRLPPPEALLLAARVPCSLHMPWGGNPWGSARHGRPRGHVCPVPPQLGHASSAPLPSPACLPPPFAAPPFRLSASLSSAGPNWPLRPRHLAQSPPSRAWDPPVLPPRGIAPPPRSPPPPPCPILFPLPRSWRPSSTSTSRKWAWASRCPTATAP